MDYLIGAIDYHEWADVCCWYRSAKKTGFTGKIVLFVYEHTTNSTLRSLEKAGIGIEGRKSERSVNNDRWKVLSEFCEHIDPADRIVTSDVRDVSFQKNPSDILDGTLRERELAIADEGWKFGQSDWNLSNVRNAFPHLEEAFRDYNVYCCGVVCGTAKILQRAAREVYDLCLQGLHYNCDQPAWNYIVRQDWIAGRVNLLPYGNPYIIHAGPLEGSEREKFQAIVGKQNIPSFDSSTRQMKSFDGSLFAAFHQYTRVSKIRNAVLSRNGCLFEFYRGKLLVAIRERLGIGPKWTPYWQK
jgi:hypothetical protein